MQHARPALGHAPLLGVMWLALAQRVACLPTERLDGALYMKHHVEDPHHRAAALMERMRPTPKPTPKPTPMPTPPAAALAVVDPLERCQKFTGTFWRRAVPRSLTRSALPGLRRAAR